MVVAGRYGLLPMFEVRVSSIEDRGARVEVGKD